MKNKIDIGIFVKKAFEKNTQPQQPDKKVLERIHKTLDKPKMDNKNILFWMTFSVLLIGSVSYLLLNTSPSGLQNENSIVNTPLLEQSNELNEDEFIGPVVSSHIHPTNEEALNNDNSPVYYSLIIDTTKQNLINTAPIKVKTSLVNTKYDIDELFEQKTIYHYSRASDSLKIETTDKRVIDSILSTKQNQHKKDDSL